MKAIMSNTSDDLAGRPLSDAMGQIQMSPKRVEAGIALTTECVQLTSGALAGELMYV